MLGVVTAIRYGGALMTFDSLGNGYDVWKAATEGVEHKCNIDHTIELRSGSDGFSGPIATLKIQAGISLDGLV
jgi:hypothetical protein